VTEPTPETGTETPATTTPETGTEPDWKAEAEKWKALSRKNEDRLKALESRDPVKELLAKLGATPQQGQDAQAALTDRIAAMERNLSAAELKAARLEVAAVKGLTPAQAARLQGNTAEELLADADQLLSLFPANAQPTPGAPPGQPRPDPTQGSRGTGAPGMLSAADVKRLYAEGKHAEILKAQQEGRIDYESARTRR
jgi:hypothetical protein